MDERKKWSPVRIAVLIASRGLVHSRTVESIWENIKGYVKVYDFKFIFSHNKGIPGAQNYLVEEALRDRDVNYLFFVEEDVIIPEGGFIRLLSEVEDAAAIDYPQQGGYSTVYKFEDKVYWVGLGCLLVSRHVFENLKPPYFRIEPKWAKIVVNWSDIAIDNPKEKARILKTELIEKQKCYELVHADGSLVDYENLPVGIKKELYWGKYGKEYKYGGLDVNFGLSLVWHGFGIKVIPDMVCQHLKIPALGKLRKEKNINIFEVVEHDEITRYVRD